MTEETVVMNTVKVNIIQGSIDGIAKEDFDVLKADIRRYAGGVSWEQERITIDNTQSEPYLGTFDQLENLFARLADHVQKGKYGKLGFVGLVGKREIVAIVYLMRRRWEMREFKRPEAPGWYKTEEWYAKERWEEEIQWEELFKRS